MLSQEEPTTAVEGKKDKRMQCKEDEQDRLDARQAGTALEQQQGHLAWRW